MRYALNPRQVRHDVTASAKGFTLIEVLVTVVCLAVAAVIVLPAVSDNSGERLRGAAQILVADLELAQAQTMSNAATSPTDDRRLFAIDADGGGYQITTRSKPTEAVINKIGGMKYATRFGQGRAAGLAGVKVGTYSLGGDNRLGFGALGQLDQATNATIQLVCGARSVTVTLDSTTGEITIGPLQ